MRLSYARNAIGWPDGAYCVDSVNGANYFATLREALIHLHTVEYLKEGMMPDAAKIRALSQVEREYARGRVKDIWRPPNLRKGI